MRLLELEPTFYRITEPRRYAVVYALAEAHGVDFLCPLHFLKNGGPIGTHHVLCWFAGRGVPDDLKPGPGRWNVSGNDFSDLTLSPSVHLPGADCGWHGHVIGGEVSTLA